ncbi:MAG: LPS assembly lipoprotein LptE [Zoogloeaceae bacterium]|jgi:LPS-assembly lipoprotein|nr:LPS assembly lipoprotein LptE [Zoogloeaceae bacterium]
MYPAVSLRFALLGCLTLVLAACGFQLRGAMQLPYKSLFIGVSESSTLGLALRRQILASQPGLLVEKEKEAEAILRQISFQRERVIAAINANGQVREYQLRLIYGFRLEDSTGAPLTEASNIVLSREVTYDDNQVLSKEQEEEFLWQDMEKDLVQQILRRLTTWHPVFPEDDANAAAAPAGAR